MDLGLAGRPAVVAAASKGLGKASALALAREGASVAICARDAGALEAARDEIAEATGATVIAIPADVSRHDQAGLFVREAAEALGGCQILVANAGGPPAGSVEDFDEEDYRAAVDLLLVSAVAMAREALPRMRAAGYGRIVVISSHAARQPIRNLVLSNAVRPAVLGWAKTLSDEVAGEGITVNAVLPGRILTDRVRWLAEQRSAGSGRTAEEELAADAASIPVGRLGDPQELGDLVAYLASERAAYLTGCFIQVDGGLYRGLL